MEAGVNVMHKYNILAILFICVTKTTMYSDHTLKQINKNLLLVGWSELAMLIYMLLPPYV